MCVPAPPGPALVDTSDWLTDILAMLPSVWVLTLYIHDQWSMIPCSLIYDLWFHILWYFIHFTASLSLGTDTLHPWYHDPSFMVYDSMFLGFSYISVFHGLWSLFHLTGLFILGTDYFHPWSMVYDSMLYSPWFMWLVNKWFLWLPCFPQWQ